jgi:hypothetical protein
VPVAISSARHQRLLLRSLLTAVLVAILVAGCERISITEGITELHIEYGTVVAVECNPNPISYSLTGQEITVFRSYQATTPDGGLTWDAPAYVEATGCQPDIREFSLRAAKSTYLLERGTGISVQGPSGADFFDTTFLSDPRYRMLSLGQVTQRRGKSPGFVSTEAPGSYDALVDPSTGNLVVAMGLQGTLARTPDGQWIAAGVGDFQPATGSFSDRMVLFLTAGVLFHALFVGVYSVLWPLMIQRVLITRQGQPLRAKLSHLGLISFSIISTLWLLQWWGFGSAIAFGNAAVAAVVVVLIGLSYPAIEISWPSLRPWNARLVLVGCLVTVAVAVIVASVLFLWTQSVIESLALSKLLTFVFVAPVSVAYYRWVGPRLNTATHATLAVPN